MKIEIGDVKSLMVCASVVPKVTGFLPKVSVDIDFKLLGLDLADDQGSSSFILLLLDTEVYSAVLLEGIKRVEGFLLQNTLWG